MFGGVGVNVILADPEVCGCLQPGIEGRFRLGLLTSLPASTYVVPASPRHLVTD
jgi:hypothetical protein